MFLLNLIYFPIKESAQQRFNTSIGFPNKQLPTTKAIIVSYKEEKKKKMNKNNINSKKMFMQSMKFIHIDIVVIR